MEHENRFKEVPEIFDMDQHPDLKYKVLFPEDGHVLADKEPIPLCPICEYKPTTCDGFPVRLITVPSSFHTKTEPYYEDDEEKDVDGIAEGLLTENDLNPPLICAWFKIKQLG